MPELHLTGCGEKGDKGDPGTMWFDGHGLPGQVPEAREGDYYINLDTGNVYKLQWSENDGLE